MAEDGRVPQALDAVRTRDAAALGRLASDSQRDAERLLKNQVEETSLLAALALECGAFASSSFGAGFGGSVSALRLAEKGYRVAVIECGRRYRDEDFAKTNWNLRRYLWSMLEVEGQRFAYHGTGGELLNTELIEDYIGFESIKGYELAEEDPSRFHGVSPMKVQDGKVVSARVEGHTAAAVERLRARGVTPGLAVVLVGEDPASQVYVRGKVRACAQTGVLSKEHFPSAAIPRTTFRRTSLSSSRTICPIS